MKGDEVNLGVLEAFLPSTPEEEAYWQAIEDYNTKERAKMEPCSVYEVNFDTLVGLHPVMSVVNKVCGDCASWEDARDIALFFQKRDRELGYRYIFTNETKLVHCAWAWYQQLDDKGWVITVKDI